MRLIENWHRVLLRAWSVWCIYLAIAIKLATECLPYIGEVVPWWLSIGVLSLGLVLRIIKQGARGVADSDE